MTYELLRPWLIRWLYALAALHFLVGLLIPWTIHHAIFSDYHQHILNHFWPAEIPAAAVELQTWWMSILGATIENLAILMAVLIYVGDRYRIPLVWGWMIISLLVWAPQDMVISLTNQAWSHVWIDVFALFAFLPPLFVLWRGDLQRREDS